MNRAISSLIWAVIAALSCQIAHAGGLGTVVSKQGNWTVYRDADAMTDKISCVAIYKGRPQIQLTSTSLSVTGRGRGGVSAYRFRLDDAPPSELRLASQIEKQVGAVFLEGNDFAAMKNARRLRFQVLTILDSMFEEDIDLSALPKVLDYLNGPSCR